MKRFCSNLYTIETIVFRDHRYQYIRNEDGTLFSGQHKTKILPQDLPEWYVYGRFYKCFGYLSAKGITDLLYVPSRFSNHYLKDDALYIAYGGKIQQTMPTEYQTMHDCLSGFDERIWGNDMIDILKGARAYSNYDISGIIRQLKAKKEWLIKEFPDEFGDGRLNFDVDAFFAEGLPKRYISNYDNEIGESLQNGE